MAEFIKARLFHRRRGDLKQVEQEAEGAHRYRTRLSVKRQREAKEKDEARALLDATISDEAKKWIKDSEKVCGRKYKSKTVKDKFFKAKFRWHHYHSLSKAKQNLLKKLLKS